MPFTLQEIEKLFEGYYLLRPGSTAGFVTTNSYPVIADYLTGQTNNLQGIARDPGNFQFGELVNLIKDPVNPSTNDQLLLDVILHPDIIDIVGYRFFDWLADVIISRNDERAMKEAVNLFKIGGCSNDDMLEILLSGLETDEHTSQAFHHQHSPLKTLLISLLPKQLPTTRNYSNRWNEYFFELLEEFRPNLIGPHIGLILSRKEDDFIRGLLQYKGGKYISLIIEWLREPATAQYELATKFHAAICLYEMLGGQYLNLIEDSARIYLEKYKSYSNKNSWEGSIYLEKFRENNFNHLSYSGVAIHYLAQSDADFAKKILDEWFANKIYVSIDMLRVFHFHLGKNALPFLKLALLTDSNTGTTQYWKSVVELLEKEFQPTDYLEIIWELAVSKPKPLREVFTRIVVKNDAEALPKAELLLKNKNAEVRQTAANILSKLSSARATETVKQLLDSETNDDARDIYLQMLKDLFPRKAELSFIKHLVAAAAKRKKLSRPLESWLEESNLPLLYLSNGEQLTSDEVRFLLYRMSRVKGMRSDIEANLLIDFLDKEKATDFANHIFRLYNENGTKADQKYLMALSALLGDEDLVDQIRITTNKWIEDSRFKMAEYGVGALALQGSDKALRWVEWYSRKYKNKKANVGAAALQALEDAAEELGITIHELGDRVIPDFGFNGLYKEFAINGEEFRAFIDSNFKLCFINDSNKKLKSLPSTTDASLKEEFKEISKEIRDVVKSQSGRLEYYLVIQRKWSADAWKKFFLNNPVIFMYATRLLWGVYNSQGDLTDCFRCLEDTSLVNIEDDEIELQPNQQIGIVHPLHLTDEQLKQWKRKYFDLSIEEIFPQLERSVNRLKAEDMTKSIIHDFVGREMQSGAIKATLERCGWQKGAGADGGFIDSFILRDPKASIIAVLEVEGVFVGGFGYDQDPKLGRLYFIDTKRETSKWFQSPADEKDERLIMLKDLSPILYSEIIGNIQSIKMKVAEANALT